MSEFDRLKAQKDGIVNKENQMAHLACDQEISKHRAALVVSRNQIADLLETRGQFQSELAAVRTELTVLYIERNILREENERLRIIPDAMDQLQLDLSALRAFAEEILKRDDWVTTFELHRSAHEHGLLRDGQKTERLCPEMAKLPG